MKSGSSASSNSPSDPSCIAGDHAPGSGEANTASGPGADGMTPSADQSEFQSWHTELRDHLQELRGLRVVVLLNRGNRGDGVIHLGGRRLLESAGLRWTEIHESKAPPAIEADALLVFGCGAFCRGTHSLVDVVTRWARRVPRIVLLPASFDLRSGAVRRFVGTWDDRYTVFCRERRSFEALRAARVRPGRLLLSHDLAFHADLRTWAARPHADTAGIFRRDGEAVFDRRPRGLPGQDISRGPDSEPQVLLDFVARFAAVHTDRAHVAITAAMMGRDVWFYRNSYFKNEALYEHSLAHLPRVRFVGRQPFSLRQFGAALFNTCVRRNAYRVRARWRAARETLRRSRSLAWHAAGR